MKKILVAIALALVIATLAVLPVVAADDAISVEELIKWNVDGIHYVGTATTTPPTQDGIINEGEYTYTYRMVDPIFPTDSSYNKIAYNPETDYSSNYVDYYVSYDEDYVYIGIYDDQSKEAGKRLNFFVRFGIDLEDVSNLVGPGTSASGGQIVNKGSKATDFYAGTTSGKDARYQPVNGKQIKFVENVYMLSQDDGYGSYDSVYELKINRSDVLEIFNGTKGTGYSESPDVFFFTNYYNSWGPNEELYSYFRWGGKALTNIEKLNLGTTADFIPLILVLGEEGDDFLGNGALEVPTKPVETEAPTTEAPTTEAPTTEVPTEAPTTEAPTTEVTDAPTEAPTTDETPAEGGCGSSVAAMGIALVAALGTCAVVVSKKKED